MNNMLLNKKVMVTGASPDLGLILAIYFASQGAQLFLLARSKNKAELTAEMVLSHVPATKIFCYGADYRNPSEIESFAKDLKGDTHHLDVLVNNAGFWLQGEFLNADDQGVVEAINSTLTGTILMTKHMLPFLRNANGADIVNISSLSADPLTSEPCHEAYSAAKSAMGTFSSRVRNRFYGHDIKVTTIYPPKFVNKKPLLGGGWIQASDTNNAQYTTDKQVVSAIEFALSQDRVCCISEIYMSNNN